MGHAPGFRLETSSEDARTTITVSGELDRFGAQELTRVFEHATRPGETSQLVLDMRNVSFIDSAGLRAVIEVEKSARERRVQLEMTPPPSAVTELLRISGLDERLNLGPSPNSTVTDEFSERVVLRLAANPAAPSRARAEIHEAMRQLPGEDIAVAALLTSELITNAVIHAPPGEDGTVRLLITTSPERLRIDVADGGSGFDPKRPQPRRPDQGGRGLLLVDALSGRWGAGPLTEDGFRFGVWFELDLGDAEGGRLSDP